jgi:hypothetical protein
MRKKLDKIAGDLYLGLYVANDYPEQEPEHKFAKWYDLFWLLIPICGFIFFATIIELRGKRNL